MKNLFAIALSTLALTAHAWEPEVYAGANLASWQYNHDNSRAGFTVNSLEGLGGMKLFKYLAVEGRAGVGLNTARATFINVVTTNIRATDDNGVELENEFGEPLFLTRDVPTPGEVEMGFYGSFYFKPMLANDTASLYGLLGFTTVELEHVDSRGTVFDDTEGDLSYGFGVSFLLWEKAELTAEWKKLVNASDFDLRGGSLGFIYKF